MAAGTLQNSKEFLSTVESKHMDSIAGVIFFPFLHFKDRLQHNRYPESLKQKGQSTLKFNRK